jgi:hypothetical protein
MLTSLPRMFQLMKDETSAMAQSVKEKDAKFHVFRLQARLAPPPQQGLPLKLDQSRDECADPATTGNNWRSYAFTVV